MITFSNGHSIEFCCASGALGFDGRGYWWEQPFRWTGLLDPSAFTIITKTLTYSPLFGNLKMWCPWRCVSLLPEGGAVNAVGLTNMGYKQWYKDCYPRIWKKDYKIIISLCPFTEFEAKEMTQFFNVRTYENIVGLEINLSCPNVIHDYNPVDILRTVKENTLHPLIAKVAYKDLRLCKQMEEYVEAFDVINTVPWDDMGYPTPSPLAKYGLKGGVSGPPIRVHAREAITTLKNIGCTKPILSGGGIDSLNEVYRRQHLGADAFSFGTLFLRAPWVPNQIVRDYRKPKDKL